MSGPDLGERMHRADVAIEAAADALLAVCALQTGTEPRAARRRAIIAIEFIYRRAEEEAAHP